MVERGKENIPFTKTNSFASSYSGKRIASRSFQETDVAVWPEEKLYSLLNKLLIRVYFHSSWRIGMPRRVKESNAFCRIVRKPLSEFSACNRSNLSLKYSIVFMNSYY